MIRLDVKRPVNEVWAYATDVTRHSEWTNTVQSVRLVTPGPIGIGTRFVQTIKLLGKQSEGEWEITEFEPNRKFTVRGASGPMRMAWTMNLKPIEGGTHIAVQGQCEPGGFFKVATPILRAAMKRQADGDFMTMKDLLEAAAPAL